MEEKLTMKNPLRRVQLEHTVDSGSRYRSVAIKHSASWLMAVILQGCPFPIAIDRQPRILHKDSSTDYDRVNDQRNF